MKPSRARPCLLLRSLLLRSLPLRSEACFRFAQTAVAALPCLARGGAPGPPARAPLGLCLLRSLLGARCYRVTQLLFMARPKSPDHLIRHRTIGVRVNAAELAELESKANTAGVSVTEWLRLAGLRRRAPAGIAPAINRQAWAALARSAANLNQLTKAVNEGRQIGVDVNALRIMYREIQTLRQQLLGVSDDSKHQ